MTEPIPAVCFIRDVCRALRISRTTLKRLRRNHAFPIPELSALDKHPRWSGSDVQKFIASPRAVARKPWKRTA